MTKKKFLKGIDNLIRNTSGPVKENDNTVKAPKLNNEEQTESGIKEIILPSLLTIDQSDRIKEEILEAYKKNRSIRLIADRCDNIDLSVMQLFYSLYKTALREKKEIEINIPINEEQKNLLINAGIYRELFTGEKENRLMLINKN